MMTPKEVAIHAVKALDDHKGVDIRVLEITDVTTIADHFVICRHLQHPRQEPV